MNRLPPLRAMQIFEAVGRYASLAEAARRLSISPAAVSQQIKSLEEYLGISLVVREGRHIRLTKIGQQYHASCATAFESLRVASAVAEYAKNKSSMSVSALPSLMSKWLAPHLDDWHRQHPQIDLYLDGGHAEPAQMGYEIDFRITYSDRIKDAMNYVELFRDCVVPVCSPELLESKHPMEQPEDVLAYPLLSVDWLPKFSSPPSWKDWFDATGTDSTAARDGYCVFSLSSMMIQAASQGRGVALAQYSMIQEDLTAGRLIIPIAFPLQLPSSYYLTWSSQVFDVMHCRDFHRWLIQKGKEQRLAGEHLMRRASTGR